jgi:hypothetical protein
MPQRRPCDDFAFRGSIAQPMTAPIKLQSSYGDFDPAFVKQLPAMEKAMIDQGLDPSAFVIAKNLAQQPRLPIAFRPDGNPLEYTVFVKGRSFTRCLPPSSISFSYLRSAATSSPP